AEIAGLLVERVRALRVFGLALAVVEGKSERVAPAAVLGRARFFEERGGAFRVLGGDVSVADEDAGVPARLGDALIAALAEDLGALRGVGRGPLAEGEVRPVRAAGFLHPRLAPLVEAGEALLRVFGDAEAVHVGPAEMVAPLAGAHRAALVETGEGDVELGGL